MTVSRTETDVAEAPITVDERATPADLTVRVIDRARDDRHFEVTVSSPWLPELKGAKPEDWILDQAAADLVQAYMKGFTAKGVENDSRLYSLQGAGAQLWDAAPEGFRKAYKKLVEDGKPPQTIQVDSDEKHIPWELMIPLDIDPDDVRPLGQRCAIARWFTSLALRSVCGPLADARVVAPAHSGVKPLAHAPAEMALVLGQIGGRQLTPAVPKTVETELTPWAGAIVHVICHGEAGTIQRLLLDGAETLDSVQVQGMFKLGAAWKAREVPPIVFLNACEVGRPAPTLSGAGGMAGALATIGAGAVIAPLWSVRDSIAHEVAKLFYEAVARRPDQPYAEILRDIRALAYAGGGEDTYAAYCYYGDPYASATRN
jgi:hypothetical protein